MTTNTQLLPTDDEIDALNDQFRWDTTEGRRASAREVLARWGQPAHSGEPVGYLYCGGSYGDELADWEIVADQLQCDRLNEHHGALGKEAKLPLYTAPQPSAQRDALDAARYRAIRDCNIDERNRFEHYSGPALDVVLDKYNELNAAQEGKSHDN